jgi:hypothetical protein
MFRITDGEPGEIIMDTLGLTAFALRDLQRRYVGLEPSEVAGWLFEVARMVFERGDFMNDRDTIDGVDTRWRCHHDVSGVHPARNVVDFRTDAQSFRGAASLANIASADEVPDVRPRQRAHPLVSRS